MTPSTVTAGSQWADKSGGIRVVTGVSGGGVTFDRINSSGQRGTIPWHQPLAKFMGEVTEQVKDGAA